MDLPSSAPSLGGDTTPPPILRRVRAVSPGGRVESRGSCVRFSSTVSPSRSSRDSVEGQSLAPHRSHTPEYFLPQLNSEEIEDGGGSNREEELFDRAEYRRKTAAIRWFRGRARALADEMDQLQVDLDTSLDTLSTSGVEPLLLSTERIAKGFSRRSRRLFHALVPPQWTIEESDPLVKQMRNSREAAIESGEIADEGGLEPTVYWRGPAPEEVFGSRLLVRPKHPYKLLGVYTRRSWGTILPSSFIREEETAKRQLEKEAQSGRRRASQQRPAGGGADLLPLEILQGRKAAVGASLSPRLSVPLGRPGGSPRKRAISASGHRDGSGRAPFSPRPGGGGGGARGGAQKQAEKNSSAASEQHQQLRPRRARLVRGSDSGGRLLSPDQIGRQVVRECAEGCLGMEPQSTPFLLSVLQRDPPPGYGRAPVEDPNVRIPSSLEDFLYVAKVPIKRPSWDARRTPLLSTQAPEGSQHREQRQHTVGTRLQGLTTIPGHDRSLHSNSADHFQPERKPDNPVSLEDSSSNGVSPSPPSPQPGERPGGNGADEDVEGAKLGKTFFPFGSKPMQWAKELGLLGKHSASGSRKHSGGGSQEAETPNAGYHHSSTQRGGASLSHGEGEETSMTVASSGSTGDAQVTADAPGALGQPPHPHHLHPSRSSIGRQSLSGADADNGGKGRPSSEGGVAHGEEEESFSWAQKKIKAVKNLCTESLVQKVRQHVDGLKRDVQNCVFDQEDARVFEYWRLKESDSGPVWTYEGLQWELPEHLKDELPMEGRAMTPEEVAAQEKARERPPLDPYVLMQLQKKMRGVKTSTSQVYTNAFASRHSMGALREANDRYSVYTTPPAPPQAAVEKKLTTRAKLKDVRAAFGYQDRFPKKTSLTDE